MKIIHICGEKNCGKTTLIQRLIPELQKLGHRVGTIKHTSHDHEFDTVGTDSWKHQNAGSEAALIISPSKVVAHRKRREDEDLSARIAFFFKDYDIVLCEGDRNTHNDIIDLAKKGCQPADYPNGKVIAAVSPENRVNHSPSFDWNDAAGTALWISQKFLK